MKFVNLMAVYIGIKLTKADSFPPMKPPRQFRQLSQTTILTVRVVRAVHTDENHPGAVHPGVKA